jgi:hypothetical protein
VCDYQDKADNELPHHQNHKEQRIMTKKWLSVLVAVCLVLSVSASAFAQDDGVTSVYVEDVGWLPAFTDGRLNAFDQAAPVVIYYTNETILNDDGEYQEVVNGIELWAVDPETSSSKLVMSASLDEIAQLLDGSVDAVESSGYSLGYEDGWFSVTAPADSTGSAYSFSWENVSVSA